VRFESTARWLRGRLVDRLRDTAPGSWVAIRGPLGDHPPEAVGEALRRLAADGLVELDASGRARLPVVRAEAALRP
jgi:predicted transcriptional regulator